MNQEKILYLVLLSITIKLLTYKNQRYSVVILYKFLLYRTNWFDNLFALFKRVCGNVNTDGDIVSNDADECTTSTPTPSSNSHYLNKTKNPTTTKVPSNLKSSHHTNKTTTSPTTSTQNRANWLIGLRTTWNRAKSGLKQAKKNWS